MGKYTNMLEGISAAEYETALVEAAGDRSLQKHIRSHATDANGRYHYPETEAFWQEEARREERCRE